MRAIVCATVLIVATTCIYGQPFTFPRPADGKVTETSTGSGTVTLWVTDKTHDKIPATNYPITRLLNRDNGFTTEFQIPAQVQIGQVGQEFIYADVFDITQDVKLFFHTGEVSTLSIEAVFKDPNTGLLALGNIFGTLLDTVGFSEVRIPDLFADTDGDGVLGEGDQLYSVIDLNVYLNAIPSFSLGDSFSIIDGRVSGLPGMIFSATPFTFDPIIGFIPSSSTSLLAAAPLNTTGIANAEHGVSAAPEPGSLILLGSQLGVFVALSAAHRKFCRK